MDLTMVEPTLHMTRIQVRLDRIVSSADCTPCKLEEKPQGSDLLLEQYLAQMPLY
jgi:hypothetical protein